MRPQLFGFLTVLFCLPVVLALSANGWVLFARIARAQTLLLRESDFVGAARLLAVGIALRSHDVETNVVFHHLRHEAVHGAAGRGDELQNLSALDLALERPLDRLDLAAQATDAIKKLGLFTNGVGHRGNSANEDTEPHYNS